MPFNFFRTSQLGSDDPKMGEAEKPVAENSASTKIGAADKKKCARERKQRCR